MNIKLVSKLILTALILLGLLLSGCEPKETDEVRITAAGSEAKVELTQGQVLVVTLESNITTGYSWVMAELPGGVLEQEGDAVYTEPAANQGKVGAGGYETLRFKALKAGEGTLKLEYRRPWEKDAAPEKEFTVQVVVK